MGGTYREDTDTLPNLLVTHPLVHNLRPAKDTERLDLVPFVLQGRVWALLTPAGGYLTLPNLALP
jgi:hypothetical protein